MKVELKKGRYFLGDVRHALSDRDYDIWIDGGRINGEVAIDGIKMAVCDTASDAVWFIDGNNNQYIIKDGNIGLLPQALWRGKHLGVPITSDALRRFGLVIDVYEKVEMDVEEGIFYIIVDGNEPIEIDTECDPEPDDDYIVDGSNW